MKSAWACLWLFLAGSALAAEVKSNHSLLFTSFRKNGEDGLHLAWSRDGYQWQALKQDQSFLAPKVGGQLMRDPSLIQGPDGTFHLVWTTAWNKHGLGYAHSRDLVHWSGQQLIDVMKHEPLARNVWAPELFFDPATRDFLICWSTTIPGRYPATEKTGDDGYNHRVYLTSTRDFQTFTPTRLFYDPGFNCIDAAIFQDGSRYLMVFKDETRQPPAKNLRLATAEKAAGPYGKPSPPITGKYWAEGPTAIRLGDTWHVYFDRYTEHRCGLVVSKDLEHWTDESDRVRFPADHRHGAVLRISPELLDRLIQE